MAVNSERVIRTRGFPLILNAPYSNESDEALVLRLGWKTTATAKLTRQSNPQ